MLCEKLINILIKHGGPTVYNLFNPGYYTGISAVRVGGPAVSSEQKQSVQENPPKPTPQETKPQ